MKKPDAFTVVSVENLYKHIEKEYAGRKEIFGIPENLFFQRNQPSPYPSEIFGQRLTTPFGVAAGPHTQLAQNIIAAWLCGASYFELKTIQSLDELEISKPCIDMQDEGYNCEWSQELRIQESFGEYLKAWILIHWLEHKFRVRPEYKGGVVFNMSAGYNLEGILKPNVQWFFDQMQDCSAAKTEMINRLRPYCPEIGSVQIPARISDNITLSTMHGCPPDEIGKIANYLLSVRHLHTFVKLNPTLLGPSRLREILNERLGFKTQVPDEAFAHDLKYPQATALIRELSAIADQHQLVFGVKLTNTLESLNHKDVFPSHEPMMYMSGRALHPISLNVARKLQNEFEGRLNVSFSAGADCFNLPQLLSCGLSPVTVCSDLLRPGGYGRLHQYVGALYGCKAVGPAQALENLNRYADDVLANTAYINDPFEEKNIKSRRPLNYFDCVQAPCVDECPTNQDIPEYLFHASHGDIDAAMEVILAKNPFPNVLGVACDHLCQTKCTRMHYDEPIKIKEIKRFVAENAGDNLFRDQAGTGKKVAIIGAGPSGLSCAYFMRLGGVSVEIFESRALSGGMVSEAIPSFRLKEESIRADIQRIEKLGVKIHYEATVDADIFHNLQQGFDAVYIAAGAQRFKTLGLEGENAAGVMDPFVFLNGVKKNVPITLGNSVVVIGGGNTAMDVARTAKRMMGDTGSVKVVYRRTRSEMPADSDEIKALFSEGIELLELRAPSRIITANGKITALECQCMQLLKGKAGERPQPVPMEGKSETLAVDTLIPALGQETSFAFVEGGALATHRGSYATTLPKVYIGGDALRGAATIVKAVGDGRKAAVEMAKGMGILLETAMLRSNKKLSLHQHTQRRATRVPMQAAIKNSGEVMDKQAAIQEASRCLYCGDVCNVCVSVCPNRANLYYATPSLEVPVWELSQAGNDPTLKQADMLVLAQGSQIANLADFCNHCGNCTTFCPTSGAPFRDKPSICLTSESFGQAIDGYFFQKQGETFILKHKFDGEESTLTKNKHNYIFENKLIMASFDLAGFNPTEFRVKTTVLQGHSLRQASEMKILLDHLPDFVVQYTETAS